MSANRDAKVEKVAQIQEMMHRAKSVVMVDYIGLNVEEVTNLRNQFRAAGVEYRVLKNTLIGRAADELQLSGLDEYLKGTTAVAFSYQDPTAGPKVIKDFIAKSKKATISVKCGILEKSVMTAQQVENLANLPSKEAVISMLMSVMNAPARGFATVLNQIPTSLVRALDAIREQKASA